MFVVQMIDTPMSHIALGEGFTGHILGYLIGPEGGSCPERWGHLSLGWTLC